ncbi:MAG: bifunctional metallophosphatase/5'-nucleotidase [Deltaproteobacteria bacterium]|nr:bifunctional metallophosphatase/5'-nucleotidase [Deltaproteobacteria bacterium]
MRSLLLVAAVLAVGGCRTATAGQGVHPSAPPEPPPRARGSGALHLLITTDEHGWLQPLVDEERKETQGGVLALFDRLSRVEGYAPGPDALARGYLLLSTGDMWTGPYESTLLEGAPMVAAMNRMGYSAAAVGNHDFDFGVQKLGKNGAAARYPLLAANLVEVATGELPAWARPFTIVEAGGVAIGVVGLTNVDTPVTSDPRHLTGLSFLPYAETLDAWIPRARAAGAQEIVVLIHDELALADQLLPVLRKHRVRAASFGHHHQAGARIDDAGTAALDDDVAVCNAGAYLRSYCVIELTLEAGALTKRSAAVKQVRGTVGAPLPSADAALAAIVADAEKHAERIGGEVLVESKRPLRRGPRGELGQLVVDSWLAALPWTQVAITNAGGIRQDLAAGPVRVRDVASVLPFNNFLLVVELTGAELKQALANEESVVAGVRYRFKDADGMRRVTSLAFIDGKPIADGDTVRVVINDFMYRGGDRYTFASWDEEPEETAIDWREPVLRRLRALGQQGKVLEQTVDERARPE